MSEDHIWKVAQSVGFDDYELRPMLEAFAALAQQAQEPVGDRYFSYSTDMGFEEFATQQEAIDCSNVQINGYREDAIRDDEWPDEVDSVCWGVILGRSKEIDTSDEDHESVDYKLYTTPPAPQPAAPVVSDDQIRKTVESIQDPGTVAAFHNGYYTLTPDELRRAILALRPAVEPMTPFTPSQRMRLWQNTEKGKSATSLGAFERICQAVEAAHRIGITAKAEDAQVVPDDVERDAGWFRRIRDGSGWPAVFAAHDAPEPLRGDDLDSAMTSASHHPTPAPTVSTGVTVAIDHLHNERRDGMTDRIWPPVKIGTKLRAV